jgi:hypothetical protein
MRKLPAMKAITPLIITLIVFCLSVPVSAKRRRLEKDYQQEWCTQHQGQAEIRLPDGTRCDCIATIDGVVYAIEFDFGSKWAEAIGQSLYYAVQTRKIPGIVLILENEKDYKYYIRLNTTLKYHHLDYVRVWIITRHKNRSNL